MSTPQPRVSPAIPLTPLSSPQTQQIHRPRTLVPPPTPNPSSTVSTTPSTVQSSQGQSIAAQTHSIFRFRSERPQWLALAGIVLALMGLVSAWLYSARSDEYDKWQSEKDYYLYCQSLAVSSRVGDLRLRRLTIYRRARNICQRIVLMSCHDSFHHHLGTPLHSFLCCWLQKFGVH